MAATRKMPRPRKFEYFVRRTTTRKGTRKMRNSVSEFGRFQISAPRSSRSGERAGTGVGFRDSRTGGVASVDGTDMRESKSIVGISIRALTFLRLLPRISVPTFRAKVAELVDALVSGASG